MSPIILQPFITSSPTSQLPSQWLSLIDFVAKIRERTKDRHLSTHEIIVYDKSVPDVKGKMNVSQIYFLPRDKRF